MRSLITIIFSVATALLGCGTLFFAYYGARLVHAVVTFEGEGSLGHVGLYIAAGLFPALALICGALTHLAWRTASRSGSGHSG